jgi:Tfp pilus assembly protein PilV
MYELTKQNTKRCRQKGLSIIEVATASVLLIVAMAPILKSLTKAHMYSSEVESKTQSLVYAKSKLDEIRARSVYSWISFTASNVAVGGSYLCNITDDGNATLKTITVSAGRDQNLNSVLESGEIEVSLVSYVAKRW